MPTTILTEGWAPAGERFRAMLARQLDGLAAEGRFDVSISEERCATTAIGAEPDLVYRFGPPAGGRRGAPAGRIAFWPATRGGPGQGRVKDRAAASRGRVVVPSRWSRDRLVEAGMTPDVIAVVPPGVDGEIFSPLSHPDRAAVRAKLGLPEGETTFLHLGGFGADGGADLVLRAFARLRAGGAPVRLVLAPDDAGETRDVERVVREAAASEPDLLTADCLATIVTVPSGLAAPERRLLIGAADALVSPDRAAAFAFPVLEAIACGTPAVVTRGGAADDICCDDLAWRIGGELRRAPGEGCWIEPDLDELTDALAAIAEGRGFDRLRFAAARMGLLRRATWGASARALADVLEPRASGGVDAATRPTILRGMPQPLGNRFASGPEGGLAAQRRRARPAIVCPGPQDLSVVVQGPCHRRATEPGAPSIDDAVASIRRSFPGAQVIVSTWLGSDIDGLDADDIVLSPDPGSLNHPQHLPNNVNRMVTSTANGLAAATRPFCVKTRNDVLFGSDALARCTLSRADMSVALERRIWTSAARLDTSLRPYHPCDMVHFGLTDDLRSLWGIAATTWDEVFSTGALGHLARLSAEQAVFVGYLRGLGHDPRLEATFDVRPEIVAGSIRHMLGAFDVFDAPAVGVVLSARFRDNVLRPRLYDTHASYEALRSSYLRDREAACSAALGACRTTIQGLTAVEAAPA